MSDLGRALEDFDRVVGLRPGYAAYCNRGNAYYLLGEYDRAIADYRRAISLRPRHAAPYYNLACAHAVLGRSRKSCHWSRRAINLDLEFSKTAQTDNDFDAIRDDDRFQRLLEGSD